MDQVEMSLLPRGIHDKPLLLHPLGVITDGRKMGNAIYTTTQGAKKDYAFICPECLSHFSHRVDNLTGPSRPANSATCPRNQSHAMYNLFPRLEVAGGNKWEQELAHKLHTSDQLIRAVYSYPALANLHIKVGGAVPEQWGFDVKGEWDIMVWMPVIDELLLIDLDSEHHHASKARYKGDVKKSLAESRTNVTSVRLREVELGSVFGKSGPPQGVFELLHAFMSVGSKVNDFSVAIDYVSSMLEFIAVKHLYAASTAVQRNELNALLKTAREMYGERVATRVMQYRNAYMDRVINGRKFGFTRRHKEVYKAYYDNAQSDNWRSERSIRPARKMLAGWVRDTLSDGKKK